MPRNSNPAAGVIAFFETCELEVAEVVLSLARATVNKRRKIRATPKPHKPRVQLGESLPPADPNPPAQTTTATRAPRVRKPKDVPLPGVVSEVGEA